MKSKTQTLIEENYKLKKKLKKCRNKLNSSEGKIELFAKEIVGRDEVLKKFADENKYLKSLLKKYECNGEKL